MLFFGMLGFIPILMPDTGGALTNHAQVDESHGVNRVVHLAVWIAISYILLKSRFRLKLKLRSAMVGLAYCAMISVPILFAKDRQGAVTAGFSMTISTIYAIYLITKFPVERFAVMLGWVVMIVAVASALFGVLLPQYGIDHTGNTGAWQGVLGQKNSLGLVMAYGVAIALSVRPTTFPQRIWKLAMFGLCLALVGLSRSREAWAATAALLIIHLFFKLHSRFARTSRGAVLTLSLVAFGLGAGVLVTNWVTLLKLMGRDPTMSGRTTLWKAVLVECNNHMLLGHSENGFWGTAAANRLYGVVGWIPTSAHNGFLECLLDYGILALVPLCLLFVLAIGNGIKLLYRSPNYETSKLWLSLILATSIFNMVQATTGFPNSISWLILIGGACILEQQSRLVSQEVEDPRWSRPMLTLSTPAS
jgi:O-antigen ligase